MTKKNCFRLFWRCFKNISLKKQLTWKIGHDANENDSHRPNVQSLIISQNLPPSWKAGWFRARMPLLHTLQTYRSCLIFIYKG